MRKAYGFGQGGKHRNTDDARHYRELTTHIARNIRTTFPNMGSIALVFADDEASRIIRARNHAELRRTLGETK